MMAVDPIHFPLLEDEDECVVVLRWLASGTDASPDALDTKLERLFDCVDAGWVRVDKPWGGWAGWTFTITARGTERLHGKEGLERE